MRGQWRPFPYGSFEMAMLGRSGKNRLKAKIAAFAVFIFSD